MKFFQKIKGFFSTTEKDPFLEAIESLTGLTVKKKQLYQLAFQHKSKNKENNERLEFLGDSILDAVISDVIYKNFPKKDEGELSKLRAKMVSRNTLNKLGNKLNLLQHLSYRETHTKQGLQNTEGNTLEALIGAIYLDLGYAACHRFVLKQLIHNYIDWQTLETEVIDHKSLLYTYCQKEALIPSFELLKENLQDETKRFHIALKINDEQVADAFGKNKKVAEQKAAKVFLKKKDK